MAEDVARAVGSASSDALTIADKEAHLKPLTLATIGTIERECLTSYRRARMEAYRELVEFLPEEDRAQALRDKVEELSQLTLEDLPEKKAYSASDVILSDELKKWLSDRMDIEKFSDKQLQRIVASLLDQEDLKPEDYKSMTGKQIRAVKIGYASWWITADMEGMVSMVYWSIEGSGITREEVKAHLGSDISTLMNLAREIESITAPSLGNG